jgi:cytochrome b561
MTKAAAPRVSSRVSRYASVAIALHWTLALLLVGMIAAGWWMTRGEGAEGAVPGTLRFTVYQLHKAFGILVLLLTLARIGWRLFNPPPPTHVIVLPWEAALSTAVYAAFYILMIALPLTGWALVSTSPTGFPTILFGLVEWPHLPLGASEPLSGAFDLTHAILAWSAAGLVALHIAGALKHQIIDRENILVRMLPGLAGRAERPTAPARGLPVVVAAPAAFVFVVLAAGVVAQIGGRAPVADAGMASAAELDRSGGWLWDVDAGASTLAFSGTQNNNPFQGVFETWRAQVRFDPDQLGASRVIVTVATASAKTGDSFVDGSIASASWLNAAAHPEAVFEASSFSSTGPGAYEALGTLTLRGVAQPLTLPFTLTLEGDMARAEGTVAIDRAAYMLGADNPTNDRAVSPEIAVTFTVEASRAQ